jgi:ABC-type branched-subunit amino acid transport system ATPase component
VAPGIRRSVLAVAVAVTGLVAEGTPLLELAGVHRSFGGVRAVDDVSLTVVAGTIAGLIGPNGAGKTTLLNLVTGQMAPDRGQIRLDGTDVAGRKPHVVAGLGVARTFQNIRLYRDLTVMQNVMVGMHIHRRPDTLARLLPFRRTVAEQQRIDAATALLRQVGLDPEATGDRLSATLPYGDQRRLEIARALALQPRLLLLDEPAAGMNTTEKAEMRDLLRRLNADGLTILLIDHDIKLVMGVCDAVTVLNFGRLIAAGTPAEVAGDERVITAYLGTSRDEPGVGRVAEAGAGVGREGDRLLDVEGLAVSYGAIHAVRDVSFQVHTGEIVALIGANGAGKSTVLNTLSGLLRARAGRAMLGDLDLLASPPQQIVKAGLVQVPEGREILARLTVEENLTLGGWTRSDRAAIAGDVEGMMDKFPILRERRQLAAGQLSGGEQQILAIARALVARPRVLLLDEPSLGLAPQLVETVFALVETIRAAGITVLLVEQNARRALELADRAYVIETGKVVLSGTGADLGHDPLVQRAYLGT